MKNKDSNSTKVTWSILAICFGCIGYLIFHNWFYLAGGLILYSVLYALD
ncbi:MAG: hypothetical protein KIC98_03955 [Clostridioides difficile]|nr:hypothetical protein [Clostridioides sp.]MBS5787043.1 hypothetical protein [Clostridioides difficile]